MPGPCSFPTVSSRFRVRTHLESTGKMWYTVFSEKNFSGMLYKNAPHSEAEIERKLSAWERINYIA